MIFISPEWYESVDFEYWKLILIINFHHGVISHFIEVPFVFLFIFTRCPILFSLNGCISGVWGPIWMIFISPEWYESVDFEYWNLILIIYFHDGVISHLVRVPFTWLLIFTETAKYCHFQIVVSLVFVDWFEWYSYHQIGMNLYILVIVSRFRLFPFIME